MSNLYFLFHLTEPFAAFLVVVVVVVVVVLVVVLVVVVVDVVVVKSQYCSTSLMDIVVIAWWSLPSFISPILVHWPVLGWNSKISFA